MLSNDSRSYGNLSRPFTVLTSKLTRQKTMALPDSHDSVKELEKVKQFLSIPSDKRLGKINSILDLIIQLKFFKTIKKDQSLEAVTTMWKHCSYEFHPPNTVIFSEGEDGSKFYVILSGSVIVLKTEDKVTKEVGRLESGDSFGERALTLGIPRSATIKTSKPCHLISIEYEYYIRILRKSLDQQYSALCGYLTTLPTLRHKSRPSLMKLSYYFKKIVLPKNSTLFTEDDLVENVYYIFSGSMKITKIVNFASNCNPNFPFNQTSLLVKWFKEEFHVSTLNKGMMIGAEEIAENSDKRLFTCVCSEDTILYYTSKQNFLDFIFTGRNLNTMKKEILDIHKMRLNILESKRSTMKTLHNIKPFEIEFKTAPKQKPRKCSKEMESTYIYTPRHFARNANSVSRTKSRSLLPMSLANYLGDRESLDYRPTMKQRLTKVEPKITNIKRSISLSRIPTAISRLRDNVKNISIN